MKKNQTGFTLVELVIVLAFTAVAIMGCSMIFVAFHFVSKLW